MQNIVCRRAQKSDSEVIKNILKETFEEYAINLPTGYSFSDWAYTGFIIEPSAQFSFTGAAGSSKRR